MPPRATLEVERAVRRQVDVVRIVHVAPRVRRIERVVRIGERRPQAERLLAVRAQVVDRAVADPGRVVERDRQRGIPGLRGVGQRRQRLVIELGERLAAVLVVPALVVVPARRRHRREAVVALEHQLDVADPHVRAVPFGTVARRALAAFRRAGRRERVRRREVRLADQRGVVAVASERPRVAARAHRFGQVDAVVVDAMRARQEAGQDRGARRLADEVGRDARREARARARHRVEVRRLHAPSFEAVAIGALLVGSDEEDVGLALAHAAAAFSSHSGFTPAAATTDGQRLISARIICWNSPGVALALASCPSAVIFSMTAGWRRIVASAACTRVITS